MMDTLDQQFATYLNRDDDAMTGSQFFEMLSEIEQRRAQKTIEVALHVVNGQAQFEPSERVRIEGNTLWVRDQRIVVKGRISRDFYDKMLRALIVPHNRQRYILTRERRVP
jgi:hypothetical protein